MNASETNSTVKTMQDIDKLLSKCKNITYKGTITGEHGTHLAYVLKEPSREEWVKRANESSRNAFKATHGHFPSSQAELAAWVYSTVYGTGCRESPVKEIPVSNKRITVKDAARCLGKSDQFVRIGLQRGLLPFGTAVPGAGYHWNYYISPKKFKEYIGAELFESFFGGAS